MRRLPIAVALALGFAACAGRQALPPAPRHLNGQALWRIVHDRCVPDEQMRGLPSPCAAVSLAGGAARGWAILKDRVGVAQHLLIPTARITGIEDGALLRPGAPNYFAKAWDARTFVVQRLGRRAPPPRLSVAVNSLYGRSQDQLHLHIDCLRADVAASLDALPIPAEGGWADHGVVLAGRRYDVRWLRSDQLKRKSPFALLAREMPGARRAMGAWTIALASAANRSSAPGFWLLADRVDLRTGDFASSEDLQDHQCRGATAAFG